MQALVVSVLLLLPSSAADSQQRLKERDQWLAEARRLNDQGKLAEAAAAVERALAVEREVLGEVSEGVALLLGEVAKLHERREDFPPAVKARRQALEVWTRLQGPAHWQTTDARLALANAEKMAELDAGQRQKLAEANRLNGKLLALYRSGKAGEAIEPGQQALRLRKEVLGERHPDYAQSLNNLAALYKAQAQYAQAESLYRQALEVRQQALGERHPDLGQSLHDLAWVCEARREYRQAEPLYLQAVAVYRQTLGNKQPPLATTLNNLAGLYRSQGQYARAEPLYREALTIRLEVLGKRHPACAVSLNNLAALYQAQGHHGKAEPLYLQALDIYEKAVGKRHPDYATGLNNLAAVYKEQGLYGKADPLYRQALAIRKEALGKRHPLYAATLNNLAALYQAQGEYSRAEPMLLQVVEILGQIRGESHPDYATGLNNLAEVYRAGGDYARAEPLLEKACAILRQALGEDHPDYAASLGNLARLYQDQGDLARAEPLVQQVVQITRKALGEDHPDYALCLNNLAALYQAQGQYTRAEPLYRQALAIARQRLGVRHADYAAALQNLAVLNEAMGNHSRAESLFRQALRVFEQAPGDRHPDQAACLHNLANLYQAQGEYGKAEPLYLQVLQLTRDTRGERHPHHATNLNNLALLYKAQQEYGKAEPLFRQVLGLRKQQLGERHPHYASSLNNLAGLYQARGEYDKAEPLYRQAVEALRQEAGGEPIAFTRLTAADLQPLPDTVLFLQNHSMLLKWRLEETATAAQLRACQRSYALALSMLERLRQQRLGQEDDRVKLAADRFDLFPQALGVLRRLILLEGKAEDLEAAFRTAELGSARAFVEALGRARGRALGGVSPELRQEEALLLARLRHLDGLLGNDSGALDPARTAGILERRGRTAAELEELLARMEKEHPQYAALKYPRPCSLAEGRACLAADEAALLFVPGWAESFVVLVDAGGEARTAVAVYPLPGAAELAEAVAALTDPEVLASPSRARTLGAELYRMLLAPLAERLRGKNLVIVPGGSLCLLPFELLRDPDGKYLVEGRRLRYAPSLTALHLARQEGQQRPRPDRMLWAVGDPVYQPRDGRLPEKADLTPAARLALDQYFTPGQDGVGPGGRLPRLRFAGEEVDRLRALLGANGVEALTGLQAREALIKAASARGELARYRYLHFATHGVLGLDVGRQPALVLSLVGDGQEDGFLQADEVTGLKLNADLVVLSACQTGKGKLSDGEGVRGLARAFLYAGSRGVVCSLWSVEDRATADLMTGMYRRLAEGRPAPEALRQAQLEMIRQGRPPLYWAPFILIGE